MGLIAFAFFFFLVLLVLVVNLYRKDKKGSTLDIFRFSFVAMLTSLSLFIVVLLLYYEIDFYNIIVSKLVLAFMIGVSALLFNTTIRIPYFNTKNRLLFDILNLSFHSIALIVFLVFVEGLFWDPIMGFYFKSAKIWNIEWIRIYWIIFFLALPSFSVIITFFKMVKEGQGIYRQQIAIYLIGLLFTLAIWIVIIYATSIFTWFMVLIPFGHIILIFFTSRSFESSIVYDKKQFAFVTIRFLFFILIFAIMVGIIAAIVLTKVRNFNLQAFYLVIIAFIFLLARNLLSQKLAHIFTPSKEYAKNIERDLQKIDYETGREEVLTVFSNILLNHLKTSGIDILISNEYEQLDNIYSTFNNNTSFSAKNVFFDYLIKNNYDVIMRSEVLVNPEFVPIRDNLIQFMDNFSSEIIIMVIDGQRLIGIISIAGKKGKQEFTNYDFDVLKELYSYFFLVIYYLRNIAKQDIILTVDREIEMSDQIIGSIQKNIDRIEGKVIDVDSVSYSAHQLGGDFIDFIKLSENRYFFLIGDISGKGLSASMSMVILKSVVRGYLSETPDFKELIVKLNIFIKDNLPKGTFFAGLFGILDLSNNTIYYLNCGIPLMLMYIDSYKNAIEIQGEGRVLGFVKNIKPFLNVRKITMNRNDIIVFTTDGLLESSNLVGTRFGNDRVGKIITKDKEKSAKEISENIYSSLLEFMSKDIDDDITILTFKHR